MSYRPDTTIIPVGAVLPWFGSITGCPALPTGWQLCDGSAITDARSPMSGQNTPTLNSGSNRMVRGNTTSGGTGGADTHTLTTAEMPSHNHTITDNGHVHGANIVRTPSAVIATERLGTGAVTYSKENTNNATTGITINNNGSGNAHNNLPGYTDAIFIIRIF